MILRHEIMKQCTMFQIYMPAEDEISWQVRVRLCRSLVGHHLCLLPSQPRDSDRLKPEFGQTDLQPSTAAKRCIERRFHFAGGERLPLNAINPSMNARNDQWTCEKLASGEFQLTSFRTCLAHKARTSSGLSFMAPFQFPTVRCTVPYMYGPYS